ncbi:MAG: transcription-repair coupling factor [Eubacteriales bacterium]|nr:transcription-repair coupling factor [Eubacteriales bacterium]
MLKTLEKLALFDGLMPSKDSGLLISGAEKNARLIYALYLAGKMDGRVLFVCSDEYDSRKYYDELVKTSPPARVLRYPAEPFYFTYPDSYSREVSNLRLKALFSADQGGPAIIFTSAQALTETFPKLDPLDYSVRRVGDKIEMTKLTDTLVSLGYTRSPRTEAPGQFSVRGGILDFFGSNSEHPVRVEFYGDEIDSIRSFSEETMLSIENIESFRILPFTQYVIPPVRFTEGIAKMRSERDNALNAIKDTDLREKALSESEALISKAELYPTDSARIVYPYCDVERTTIMDEIGASAVIFDEYSSVRFGIRRANKLIADDWSILAGEALAYPTQMSFFEDFDSVLRRAASKGAVIFSAVEKPPVSLYSREVYLGGADILDYKGASRLMNAALDSFRSSGYRTVIAYNGEDQKKNLEALMNGYEYKYSFTLTPGEIAFSEMFLPGGADFAAFKVALIPYHYLIPRSAPTRKRREISDEFFADIHPGDYVVHESHGIGRYEGIVRLDADGVSRDYIKIGYAKEDVLYVPPEQMDLIQKYVGAGEAPPRINRLGGGDWEAAKSKVRRVVKKLADEYIAMYAQRQNMKGYAFSPDTPFAAEFEDSFEYEPTEDQLKCTEEIKADMEKDSPMDRLLMGDVGYGKTEVAMRAAFKAVMEPKQVAVLVPTTILALQHYNTFTERFRNYPVKIELMCRFKTAAEIKKTKENLSRGITDIVIGTHSLLAKDVSFRDLGLLIIDEEQRFGVAHKDKLKLLKNEVDTLTMTATPIPRTLHMSLSGIRDMSVIETPPGQRLETQTYVMPSDDAVITAAISNELARGGQVFYLYNRVDTIAERSYKIRSLVPEARVAYAHGQMPERQLENIILDFLAHKFDVLVCTTIIENGVDIVNANTIIIEDADRLGLAQLYQLRGRVGRGDVRAYAYILYNASKELPEESAKRLKAIREFTEFGSGFKIAMRDMQIRGAGNILGAEQSGHFANVGYEMYCRLLGQAVSEGLGKSISSERKTCEIDIRTDAYIPPEYISSEEDRILAYKKIAAIESEEDKHKTEFELTDVYSDLPASVINLLDVALTKAYAMKAGITRIRQSENTLVMEFSSGTFFDGQFVNDLAKRYAIKMRNTASGTSMVLTIPKSLTPLDAARDFVANFVV